MVHDYQQLWKDVTGTTDEAEAVRTLAQILVDKEGRTFILCLEHRDAELCIEILDHGIVKHNLTSAEKQAFSVTLRRLAECYERLPNSMIITGEIEVSDKILASGGFGDVRRGRYMGHLVAVKSLKVAVTDDWLKIRKQFCKEIILWNSLSHPNVLKLAGVQWDVGRGQFNTVSEWMTHGNIMEYIGKNSVNRLELLHGAAQGLKYLHGAGLTHGDLKGANILMSNDAPPRACLADFGFMTIVLDPDQPMSCSAQLEGGTKPFMSPELLMPSMFDMKKAVFTPEADIYAFGLVIFQILTGEFPFRGVWPMELGYSVVQGLRPTKPEGASAIGFSDSLWDFAQRCWDGDAKLRPKVAEVVTHLEEAAANWDGLMPPHVRVKIVASESEELLDSVNHRGIFRSSSSMESPTESQTTFTAREPISLITKVLSDEDDFGIVRDLPGDDAQISIDMIDEALDTHAPQTRRMWLDRLSGMCGGLALVPRSLAIPLCYDPETEDWVYSRIYADVWRGQYHGRTVAAKVFKEYPDNGLGLVCRRKFCKEVVRWKSLRHPNVLPILGVTVTKDELVMVSEWMRKNNINEFVRARSNVNRLELLRDVTRGLIYMHDQGMVHGGLKGANILIDNDDRACLAGPGLLTMTSDQLSFFAACTEGGAIRWTSPELLNPNKSGLSGSRLTKESDCYALGMVIYEVLSGQEPFAEYWEHQVADMVRGGKRPSRPQGKGGTWFTDDIWGILELCWKAHPRDRISAKAVLLCLKGIESPSDPTTCITM